MRTNYLSICRHALLLQSRSRCLTAKIGWNNSIKRWSHMVSNKNHDQNMCVFLIICPFVNQSSRKCWHFNARYAFILSSLLDFRDIFDAFIDFYLLSLFNVPFAIWNVGFRKIPMFASDFSIEPKSNINCVVRRFWKKINLPKYFSGLLLQVWQLVLAFLGNGLIPADAAVICLLAVSLLFIFIVAQDHYESKLKNKKIKTHNNRRDRCQSVTQWPVSIVRCHIAFIDFANETK